MWDQDYERIPVSIQEFVESEEYLGKCVSNLQPVWKKELCEVFAPSSTITTLIFTGAIGTGKTTVASIAMLYKIYRLTCLRSPHEFFGLLPGKKIVFGCFNITLNKADTGYDLVKYYVDTSPYFQKVCPRKQRPDEPIFWPSKNIVYEIGSLSTHALGDDMLGFMMDEANFFKKTPDPTEKSRAHQLFSAAKTRLISRFMRYGEIPGLVILISSRKTQTSFLEEQMGLVEKDPSVARTTRIVSMPLWEAKPPDIYSGDTFNVAVGDESTDSRVLEEDELAPGHKVISVPIEYKQPFLEDVDDALQNIAGISIVGSYSFFTNKQSLRDCINEKRRHPFDCMEISDVSLDPRRVQDGSGVEIAHHLYKDWLFKIEGGHPAPRVRKQLLRYAHVDLGLTNDACGISIGHPFYDRGEFCIYFDIILKVVAPLGHEIDLEQVVDFFIWLKKQGMQFGAVTFDRFESRMAIQRLVKNRIQASLLSIDVEHYKTARRFLFERRVDYYEYKPLIDELIDIRKAEDPQKRPNHPVGGHDDIADSFVGVVAHCSGMEKLKPIDMPKVRKIGVPLISAG